MRSLGAVASLAAAFLAATTAIAAGPYPTNMCVGTRNGNLGCTANDIRIASAEVTNGVTTCVAGTTVDLGLRLFLQSNATQRYDVGIFLAKDGKPPQLPISQGGSADCAVDGVPKAPAPLADLNGNACGDIQSSSLPAVIDYGIVRVDCVPGPTGRIKLPAVITWESNSRTSCQAPPAAWVEASAPSKCNASSSIDIAVQVTGSLTIVKQTQPLATAGSFAFNATNASPSVFSLSHGQSVSLATAPLQATPTQVTVTESALAGWDPAADIACTGADGRPATFVQVDRANRRITANFTTSNTRATCTFTNKAESRIRVVKRALGGSDTFSFQAGQDDFAITTVGGVGERLISGLAAGTYSLTEILPAGWDLDSIVCADASGGTTVNVPALTATVNIAPGETVTCAFTNVKLAPPDPLGSINIVKTSAGGDGAFTFTGTLGGPQAFVLKTSGGVSPAKSFTGLSAGVYTVSEVLSGGWTLSSVSCADPTGGASVVGPTATINLAAGETVTCTFANAAAAAVVVEKVALGGDATFGFGGTASFSIATNAGTGRDEATFASVVAGSALTITEAVPPGWLLSEALCRDAVSGATVGSSVANGVSVTPGAGQRVVCRFTNTKLAQLTVVEVSNPRSSQPFPYTTTGAGLASFSLAQDGVSPNSRVFANLVPGQAYSVTQGAVPGWVTTLVSCNDRGSADPGDRTPVDLASRTILPNLQPGERLVCAFVNTQVMAGSISVSKVALGGDDAFVFTNSGGVAGSPNNPASFTIATAGGNGGQALTALVPGVYTITETIPSGWLSPASVRCTVLEGTSTVIVPVANGVTINLGQTGTAVDRVACAFENTKGAKVTIVEDATPDSAQAFPYSASGTGVAASFTLVNDGTPAPAERRSFAGLVAGAYGFRVSTPAGWRLTGIDCVGATDWSKDLVAGSVSGELNPGDEVTCTIRHSREGTITVTKAAVGGAAGEVFAFQGPVGLAGDYVAGQTRSIAVLPGTYAVTEVVPEGWSLTGIACSGGVVSYTGAAVGATAGFEAGDRTASITLAAGDAVACTFTNATEGAAILVEKATIGGKDIFAFDGVADFQIDTTIEATPAYEIVVAAGTHVVREIVPAGWRLTAIACDGASTVDLGAATATVSVAAGRRVRCVFTNEKLGRIELTKAILGASTAPFSFQVPAALDPSSSIVLAPSLDPGRVTRVFDGVLPGTYRISEVALPSGFQLRSLDCRDPTGDTVSSVANATADIRVAAGETVACTFTNATTGTIVINSVSVEGTASFGYTLGSFPAAAQVVNTTRPYNESYALGSASFSDLAAGRFSVTANPAPAGWRFESVSCVSKSAEQTWSAVGGSVTIDLPDGETVGCYFLYVPLAVPAEPVPVPIDGRAVLLVAMLGLIASARRRLRRR